MTTSIAMKLKFPLVFLIGTGAHGLRANDWKQVGKGQQQCNSKEYTNKNTHPEQATPTSSQDVGDAPTQVGSNDANSKTSDATKKDQEQKDVACTEAEKQELVREIEGLQQQKRKIMLNLRPGKWRQAVKNVERKLHIANKKLAALNSEIPTTPTSSQDVGDAPTQVGSDNNSQMTSDATIDTPRLESETDEKSDAVTVADINALTVRGQEVWDKPDGEMRQIGDNFYWVLNKLIGSGSFGKVYKAVRAVKKKDAETPVDGAADPNDNIIAKRNREFDPSGDRVVVKEITQVDAKVQREIEIMVPLNHPNVVKIHDHWIDNVRGKAYLVMEWAGEKELFTVVADEGPMLLDEIRDVMKQIFSGLEYLHKEGVAHRDIKLENIMVTEIQIPEQGAQHSTTQSATSDSSAPGTTLLPDKTSKRKLFVKLIDFGLAKRVEHGELKTAVGSPHYVAPEILTTDPSSSSYTSKCDLWSVGVVLFILLTQNYPFNASCNAELFRLIKNGSYSFQAFPSVPDAAKNLIRALLQVDPEHRPTASEALEHAFFTDLL